MYPLSILSLRTTKTSCTTNQGDRGEALPEAQVVLVEVEVVGETMEAQLLQKLLQVRERNHSRI